MSTAALDLSQPSPQLWGSSARRYRRRVLASPIITETRGLWSNFQERGRHPIGESRDHCQQVVRPDCGLTAVPVASARLIGTNVADSSDALTVG